MTSNKTPVATTPPPESPPAQPPVSDAEVTIPLPDEQPAAVFLGGYDTPTLPPATPTALAPVVISYDLAKPCRRCGYRHEPLRKC